MNKAQQLEWSDWLDFNQDTVSKVPEASGVFMMHASMKILYIGSSENMKMTIGDISEKFVSNATRFRYREEAEFEKIRNELIIDYKKRHEGKAPDGMN